MIALVLNMIRARAGQALTLAMLSAFATAAAVAAPMFLDTVNRVVVDNEVRAAEPPELMLRVPIVGVPYPPDRRVVEEIVPNALTVPGFTRIFHAEIPVLGMTEDQEASRLVFRADACAHLRFVRGRCMMGPPEAVVDEETAERLRIGPGDTVTVQYATLDPVAPVWLPAGAPAQLSIVGVFKPADPDALYWGANGYFDAARRPVFVDRGTLESIEHSTEFQAVDAIAEPGAITADTLPAVRAAYAETAADFERLSAADARLTTRLPDLFARIDRNREAAARLVPLAAAPLVALCWFVIFLAVGYAAQARRWELGLIALRGNAVGQRVWLAIGEAVLPVLAGVVPGYVAGRLLVRASVAATVDGPVRVPLTTRPLAYAAAAALGAALVCVVAQWRALRSPVVDLLRDVPARGAPWRAAAGDAVVGVVAAAALLQLWATPGDLAGVTLLVPALLMVAAALLGARAVAPVATVITRRALRSGRLAVALAAVQIARRPGTQRLLALLVVAVALLSFTATAVDIAARTRADRAQIELGATRVLSVAPLGRQQLVDAVREADPEGRFAMAVARGQGRRPNETPRLAVDATRLAAVATWHPSFAGDSGTPSNGGGADGDGWARAAASLRPSVAPSVTLRGTGIAVRVTATEAGPGEIGLVALLRPADGGEEVLVELGPLAAGARTYAGAAPGCATGCRLVGLRLIPREGEGQRVRLTLTGVRQTGPDAELVGAAALADTGLWRGTSWADSPEAPSLRPTAAGLEVRASRGVSLPGQVVRADFPAALPVVSTQRIARDGEISGVDGRDVAATRVGAPAGVPRLGVDGLLMDLEYADRAAAQPGTADQPEVWLSASAPPDALARLAATGLSVTGDETLAQRRERLDRQGAAIALRFHLLAAALAVLLAAGALWLVSAVDRRIRGGELRALRLQGLPARTVSRAGRWGHLGVVLAALVLGPVAAALAWAAVGDRMPIFVDEAVAVRPPDWPRPDRLLLVWVGAAVVLVAMSAVAARTVAARTVRRAAGASRAGEEVGA